MRRIYAQLKNDQLLLVYIHHFGLNAYIHKFTQNTNTMPTVTVNLDSESDQLLKAVARQERRSKREQLAFSAIAHARSILPDFVAASPTQQSGRSPMRRKQKGVKAA